MTRCVTATPLYIVGHLGGLGVCAGGGGSVVVLPATTSTVAPASSTLSAMGTLLTITGVPSGSVAELTTYWKSTAEAMVVGLPSIVVTLSLVTGTGCRVMPSCVIAGGGVTTGGKVTIGGVVTRCHSTGGMLELGPGPKPPSVASMCGGKRPWEGASVASPHPSSVFSRWIDGRPMTAEDSRPGATDMMVGVANVLSPPLRSTDGVGKSWKASTALST